MTALTSAMGEEDSQDEGLSVLGVMNEVEFDGETTLCNEMFRGGVEVELFQLVFASIEFDLAPGVVFHLDRMVPVDQMLSRIRVLDVDLVL